ncbi:class I SAM-dependent methyltransferase [Mucilaginibacter flavus]|uniref:class I SAM-dependent methyltransferase n=1 Tax=Mucilaginibacter flavus TaxID=931504 RepID=UPI0025B53ECD|nr:class I SAM-dependent methyltransferase [Mucilaginibacter flavus]MDN3581753.1 class I SAM-dependent methyltransferase [Mucilaginibacter flavus]
MKQEIHLSTAKEELKRINEVLEKPHILIGGLAIQQYVSGRNSKDIDLICEHQTIKKLIEKLYPSKNYNINVIDDDEYRPSYEITHRVNTDKIVFLGPKIWEREPYMAIDWGSLAPNSKAFVYKKEEYINIRVPAMEILAFTKLISFINRVGKTPEKGKNDLIDFINLTNHVDFKINVLIDRIRIEKCEQFIQEKLKEIEYNSEIWQLSLLLDFMNIFEPILINDKTVARVAAVSADPQNLFTAENAVEFYNIISDKYDERNTNQIFETHKKIIELISNKAQKDEGIKILDIGGGTGRLVAFHFFNEKNIEWHCVEPSSGMLKNFRLNTNSSQIKYKLFNNSIFELPAEVCEHQYDVILLSCVLTSLPNDPDFAQLCGLLSKEGVFIIADIDPTYTQKRPFYDFQLQSESVTLAPRIIDPLSIIAQVLKEALHLKNVFNIEKKEGDKYSFILEFQKGD